MNLTWTVVVEGVLCELEEVTLDEGDGGACTMVDSRVGCWYALC